MRSGGRASSACVVAYVAGCEGPSRAGVIVGRSVGGSVVRHRVARRLRHVLAGVLDDVPAGSLIVLRALPPAAGADSAVLRRDVESSVRRARARVGRRPGPCTAVTR